MSIPLLFSYHFCGRGTDVIRPNIAVVPPDIGVSVLLDSGAFSARTLGADVRLPDLIAWYRDLADLKPLMIGLDVIGDAPATRANCEAMRDAGLDVLPTVHLGASPHLIARYAADGWTYLALGGLVNSRVPMAARCKWIRQCQREAQDAGVRLHGLGWTPTGIKTLDTVRRMATVDSSSYTASTRWGVVRLFTGTRIEAFPTEQAMRALLKTHPNAHGVVGDALRFMHRRGQGKSHVMYGLSGYAYYRWGEAMGVPVYLAYTTTSRTNLDVIVTLIRTEAKERTPA